jgi:hypothetical protein
MLPPEPGVWCGASHKPLTQLRAKLGHSASLAQVEQTPSLQTVPPLQSLVVLQSVNLHSFHFQMMKLNLTWQVFPGWQWLSLEHHCADAGAGTRRRIPSSTATVAATPMRLIMMTSGIWR